MWTRFRDSLLYPRNIVEYRNDSLWWVFLYIVLFAVLLTTRTTVTAITYDGLSVADKEVLSQEFNDLNDNCRIENAVYSCDIPSTQLFYEDLLIGYYFEAHNELQFNVYKGEYNIVIYGDSLYLLFRDIVLHEQKLSTLNSDFHNLDFALQASDEDAFNAAIFATVDDFVLSYQDIWAPMAIAIDFFTSFALFIFFILISAWILRMRFREVRFKHLFVMTAYSSTGLYIILIMNSLYNLSFLLIILLIFIAFRQNNELSMELFRRLSQNKPKARDEDDETDE